jgi:hypothetical protein
MDLTGAPKLTKTLEYLANGLLNADVRVKAKSNLTMPDVADRHRDAQFASSRLGACGVQHPRSQDAQLELADAALHAQEQPVVGATRVVDAVEVDDPRLDEPAKLKQVMPIAAVAGETGCVETQYCADISCTQPGYQLLETGAGRSSTRGTTQVVVDDLDVAKSASPRFIDELILATLALEIKLNLGLSGLPNINHSLPLQNRGRQQISVSHRRSPRSSRRRLPSGGAPTERSPYCVRLT